MSKNAVVIKDFKNGYFFQVDQFLRENNLVPVSTIYYRESAIPTRDSNCIGIAFPDKLIESKSFVFFTKKTERNRVFGEIYFSYTSGTSYSKSWNFIVYGRNNLEIAKLLALDLQKRFKVRISVSLKSEYEKLENLGRGGENW